MCLFRAVSVPGGLHELDQHPAAVLGVAEVDQRAPSAHRGVLVQHADARLAQIGRGSLDVVDAEGHLLDPRAGAIEELGDGRLGGQGRQELQIRVADGQHGFADALLLVDLFMHHLQTEGPAIEGDGLVEVRNSDANVVDAGGLHGDMLSSRCRRRDGAVDLPELVAGIRAGRPREMARGISLIEDGSDRVPALLALLAGDGHARVVGITGSPGVGKSTTTSALIREYRMRGERVGVLAVDPSSPFTGGALLGDRVRMQEHATDPGVFIRSMGARGHLGGLASATVQALHVLDCAGFDVVLIETVGVGQSEVEVAATADTTVVLLAPGMGDGIQAAKAGILEVGDVICVNKADRDGAESTAREIRSMVALGHRAEGAWEPRVVLSVAAERDGIADLVAAIDAHDAWLAQSGHSRARLRSREEILGWAMGMMRARIDAGRLDALAAEVAEGRVDSHTAAVRLLAD